MTTFILHGGYARTKNELNDSFFREISNYVPEGGTILLVYFSRDDEEYDKVFEQDKEHILEQVEGKGLNIAMATKENFIKEIKEADAIYIRGGYTDKLFNTFKEYPNFSEAIEGRVVAGSSAGAYAISTYYYSNSTGKVHKGLGWAPVRVICHYESQIHENVGEPLVTMKEYPEDLELVVLRDYEWKTIRI